MWQLSLRQELKIQQWQARRVPFNAETCKGRVQGEFLDANRPKVFQSDSLNAFDLADLHLLVDLVSRQAKDVQ